MALRAITYFSAQWTFLRYNDLYLRYTYVIDMLFKYVHGHYTQKPSDAEIFDAVNESILTGLGMLICYCLPSYFNYHIPSCSTILVTICQISILWISHQPNFKSHLVGDP